MLRKIQETSPALMWMIVGVLLTVGVYLIVRQFTLQSSQEALGAEVIIRFEDTGEEIKLQRGRLERLMLEQGVNEALDPTKGLINPKTNKPTGFPINRDYWNQLVHAVNDAMKRTTATPTTPQPKP
jgi:hypothetical protein